jgi:hypothetical protein
MNKKRTNDGLPDVVLPVQMLEPFDPDDPSRRVRNLMLAILEDGIRCLMLTEGSMHARLESRRAELWIRSRDLSWPFSFDNVCLALSFDPSWVRERIFESTALQRTELRRSPGHRVNQLDARVAPPRDRRRRRRRRPASPGAKGR